MNPKHHRKLALTVTAAVALAIGSFVVVRQLSSNEPAGAQPATPEATATVFDPTPDLTATPDPEVTPDLTEDGWYVPYLNRDRELPRLEGELNGILISGEPPPPGFPPTASQECESGLERQFDAEAEERWGSSPVGLSREELPDGQEVFDHITYTVCGGTEAVSVETTIAVTSTRPGTDLGAGSIRVYRWIGPGYSGFTAAEERWRGGEVAGFPAAILEPVIESVGTSGIVVHDAESGVTTRLIGEGVYLESLEQLMEGMLQ